jgi:hypothetical protein
MVTFGRNGISILLPFFKRFGEVDRFILKWIINNYDGGLGLDLHGSLKKDRQESSVPKTKRNFFTR